MKYTIRQARASQLAAACVTPPKLDICRNSLTPFLREDFSAYASQSSVTDTRVTIADDTTNVVAAGATAIKSMKMTCVPEASFVDYHRKWALASATDFSGAGRAVCARIYLHDGEGDSAASTVAAVSVWLWQGANWRKYIIYRKVAGANPGWYSASCGLDNYSEQSATPPTMTAIDSLAVRISTTDSGKSPAVTFDLLLAHEKLPYALYAFTHDDTKTAAVTAAAYLDTLALTDRDLYPAGHMVGTFYCTTGAVGTAGFATGAQLRAMQSSGHLIANHCYGPDYTTHWTAWSLDDKRQQIALAKSRLWEEGLYGGDRCVATPGGTIKPIEDITLINEGACDQIRSAGSGMSGSATSHLGSPIGGPFVYPAMADNTADATANAQVDRLIVNGGVLLMYTHGATTYADHLAYVAAKANAGLLRVVTMDQLLDLNMGQLVGTTGGRKRLGTV